jgi:hypothetical protein
MSAIIAASVRLSVHPQLSPFKGNRLGSSPFTQHVQPMPLVTFTETE